MQQFFDAFISYSRADSKAFASQLEKRLSSLGWQVWFDQNDIPPAVDWQQQIKEGIERAHNFIFIIAPRSIKSPYCQQEIEIASQYHKRIIPLLHINAEEFLPLMPSVIRDTNWLPFQEDINDLEQSFLSLIEVLEKDRDYVEQHTDFLIQALDWLRNKKQTNYLLIGESRIKGQKWLTTKLEHQYPCLPTNLHGEFISESVKNAHNLMTQVFLSHAEEDSNFTQTISQNLMLEGFTIWTNHTDISSGEKFQDAIKRGIEEADNVVYVMSNNSLKSPYCQQELAHALTYYKRIIPLLIEPIEMDSVPEQIRSLQFINLINYQQQFIYQKGVGELIKILHQEATYYEQHKILLAKALKWQRQNHNPSILLRGYNLRYAQTWLKVAQKHQQHPPTSLHQEFISKSVQRPEDTSLGVFISYSRADADFARRLNEALQMQGKTTWFDQENIAPGVDFQQEIHQGISMSDNFLFIISPNSINSPYCADEVDYARKLNKRMVTLLYREVEPDKIHPDLAKIQWIDFNRPGVDFYAYFSELIRTLDTDREYVANHTKWLQRSREWQQKGQTADLLLRGNEFTVAQNWLEEAQREQKCPRPTTEQKAFLKASREAIVALEEQEKHHIFLLRSLLGLVSVGLCISVGAGILALSQWQRAERVTEGQVYALSQYAESLIDSDQPFDALIEGIRAGRLLATHIENAEPDLKSRVMASLRKAVYGVKERNRLRGHDDAVWHSSYSRDGQILATSSWDGTIKLWQTNGTLIKTLKAHQDFVWGISFSGNGKLLASASADHTIKLWNRQGDLLNTFTSKAKERLVDLEFSPKDQIIAVSTGEGNIELWDLEGQQLQNLNAHEEVIYSLNFSPDGQTLATASRDGTVKLWKFNPEGLLESYPRQTLNHGARLFAVNFSPDGLLLATAGADGKVKLWSTNNQQTWRDQSDKTIIGHRFAVFDVIFSPDGQTIASAGLDKTVRLWSREGRELQVLTGHRSKVYSVNFHPDGQTLVSTSWDGTIKIWEREGQESQTLTQHSDRLLDLSFSSDGKLFATASTDQSVRVWSSDGNLFATITGHLNTVMSVAFSPDSQYLASAGWDKTIKIWQLDGTLIKDIKGHNSTLTAVAFNPQHPFLASAGSDRQVKIWSLDGEEIDSFIAHRDRINSISFSPNGQFLATASSDLTVKLWQVTTTEVVLLKTFTGHTKNVFEVKFSPDGQTLATASWDGTAKLWNLEGETIQTFSGHEGRVYSISFSHHGKFLASAGEDKTVKIWDRDGQELKTLVGHKDLIRRASFSPDGKTIASASFDSNVILWDLEWENLSDLVIRNDDLETILKYGCDWVADYLRTNAQANQNQTVSRFQGNNFLCK